MNQTVCAHLENKSQSLYEILMPFNIWIQFCKTWTGKK